MKRERIVRGAIAVALALVIVSGGINAQAPSRVNLASQAFGRWLDSLFAAEMSRHDVPGVQVTIISATGAMHRAYGITDVQSRQPTTRETVFPIGSVTKSFTAAAVLLLVNDRTLMLDTPIASLWPKHGFDRRILVRHLLSHTSGLPPYESLIPDVGTFARTTIASDSILSFVRGQPVQFEPGARWSYSNTGYHLLGLAVEKASGQTYFRFVAERIAAASGLRSVQPCRSTSGSASQAGGHERERDGLQRTTIPNVNFSYAAGGLCATAADVAQWLRVMPRVVSTSAYAAMTSPVLLNDGRRHPYGFGLLQGRLGNHSYVGHGGSLPGFDAFAAHYPADSLTIVVLANGRPFDTEALQKRIARRLLSIPETRVADIPLTAAERKKYLGTYSVDGRSVSIIDGDGHLRLVGPGDFTLLYQGNLQFIAREEPDVELRFILAGEGVAGMIFTSPGRRFELRKN